MLEWLNEKINSFQPDFVRQEDLQKLPHDGYIPKLSDIVIPSVVMATILVILRYLLDRYVVTPFGAYFGLGEKTSKDQVIQHPLLETEYNKCKNPNTAIITNLSKKTQLTERQVQIWFRKRKKQDKASDLKRLQDASWQLIFYFIFSWYGIYVLWDKPWFTKSENIWPGWPGQQTVSDGIYWYYLIELAFYISSLVTLFTDHKRKDFTEMAVHHIVTILLIVLSWNYNAVRIGSLVICIHDPVDYIMAFAKIALYCKYPGCSEAAFVLFFIFWIITRLIIYPYMVLYSAIVGLPEYGMNNGPHEEFYANTVVMNILKVMLVTLQILHIFWTILIIKTAATKFTGGTLQDARSDIEDSEKEDEHHVTETRKITSQMNGTK